MYAVFGDFETAILMLENTQNIYIKQRGLLLLSTLLALQKKKDEIILLLLRFWQEPTKIIYERKKPAAVANVGGKLKKED